VSESEAAGAPATGHPLALPLALSAASRDKANAFLDLVMEELREENPLKLSCLRARRFNGYARMALEVSIGLVMLALVAGISLMVWNAAHSEGLIIESFSVPPGMADKGVTGQVIASQVLDKLTVMQSETSSARPARSYANNWGNDLKVEIPDTGMSVGELYRFARRWLGNETHISGEVTATSAGLAITARAGGNPGATFSGAEADLDKLVQQAAEHVYRSTQPYRYGVFLVSHGRRPEALAMFKAMTEKGPAQERSWAYNGLVSADQLNLRFDERLRLLQQAVALNPNNFVAVNNLGNVYNQMGRAEEAHRFRKQLRAMARDTTSQHSLASSLGAFQEAATLMAESISVNASRSVNPYNVLTIYEIGAHDMGNARLHFLSVVNLTNIPDQDNITRSNLKRLFAAAAEDWAGVIAEAEATALLRRKYPAPREGEAITVTPLVAYAKAKLGDIAGAERMIAATPTDCYPCLRMRGRIAQVAGQYDRADAWFVRAAAIGPSLPFAHAEWGQALLERGQPDSAIAQLAIAHNKSPKFADPLVSWGEALMAKNQSHLALAKFKQAEPFAPKWGRLHLKWGEALLYTGKPVEAKKQFTIAAKLDLTPSEKIQLARLGR
jgi:tetratricopeptide (TPR) repeat protein